MRLRATCFALPRLILNWTDEMEQAALRDLHLGVGHGDIEADRKEGAEEIVLPISSGQVLG